MEKLNVSLENVGFEVNGYGWVEYLCKFIEKKHPDFLSKINTDSESDTCGLYVMDSLDDYKLNEAANSIVRQNEKTADIPSFEIVKCGPYISIS